LARFDGWIPLTRWDTLIHSLNGKNIIVLREGRISPYIESVPQPNVNYIEEDLRVYSIFVEEDNIPLEQIDLDDGMWHMHFDGSCSNEGNRVGIILISPVGKIHNFSYRLEFACLFITHCCHL
jgi:hypothetical protein